MENTNKATLLHYWSHTLKHKRLMLGVYPLMLIAQIAEDFITPILVSGVLDKLARGDVDALKGGAVWWIFTTIIFLELFAHGLWNIVVRQFWKLKERVMYDLQLTVFTHLEKMSFTFFADRFAGSLVNQTNKFVSAYDRLMDPLTWNVYKLIISFVGTLVIITPKAPTVSLALIIISAVFTPVVWVVRRKQIPYTQRWAAAETKRTGQLADTISNIIAVKSFSNEQLELMRMRERSQEAVDRSLDTMRLNMTQELLTGAIQRSINVSVIILSVLLALRGSIEVGTIYLSLTFTIAIMRRLWDLNNTFRQFTRVFGDASDMTRILDIEPEIADPTFAKEFIVSNGSVAFNNVRFSYAGDDGSPLFDQLNLSIKAGEKIGLVGPSGGGKTTVTKLLLRFMDISDGSICIDGQDIRSITQSRLRQFISYVPQEPLLFHRTIAENIAYGDTKSTQEQIQNAAKNAHADEFIESLAEGYGTLVGERGVKLSGGQKQRIAIARAMIKDAPILVLDEATSALDSESEVLIQDALWKLMKDRTAIVIAHRLSTIQHLDRIIVLDKGKIVEEGAHKDLIKKKNGLYARLWAHQSGGFIQD